MNYFFNKLNFTVVAGHVAQLAQTLLSFAQNRRFSLLSLQGAAGILAMINGYLGDRGLSLRQGTIVYATLINAPSSTKHKLG